MNIVDKVWELVERLPLGEHCFLGEEGERVPLLRGQCLWDIVDEQNRGREVPDYVVSKYKEAFAVLEWTQEKIVTQASGIGTSFSHESDSWKENYVAERSYIQHCPVLSGWTLPIKPSPAPSKEDSLDWLLAEVAQCHFKKDEESIKAAIWQEWYDLALEAAYPSRDERIEAERLARAAYRQQLAAARAAQAKKAFLPSGKPRPVLKKNRK